MGTRATMNCLQKALMSATWLTGAWLSFWGLPWAVVVEKSEIFWKTILENYGEGTFGQIFFRSRHGGDFVGLTSKLPYIKGLGCEAVWISPIFQNGNNSYHQFLRLQAGGVLSRMNIRFLLAFLEDFWCAKVRHAWLHIVRQEIGNSTRTTGLDQCCAQLGDVCHCWCSHLRTAMWLTSFLVILRGWQILFDSDSDRPFLSGGYESHGQWVLLLGISERTSSLEVSRRGWSPWVWIEIPQGARENSYCFFWKDWGGIWRVLTWDRKHSLKKKLLKKWCDRSKYWGGAWVF